MERSATHGNQDNSCACRVLRTGDALRGCAGRIGSSAYDDALTALSVLGYSTSDVVPVLRQINTEGMTTEQIIKAVLKFMI